MSACLLLMSCGKGAPTEPADPSAMPTSDSGGGEAGGDSDGAGDSDPSRPGPEDSDPPTPIDSGDTGDFCDDVATVTYNNFGQGFMTENCQGCHASTAPNRYGAPEEVSFDAVEDCWTWVDRILARSTGDSPSMPPQGGVSDDDRIRLSWWLRCADFGT